MVKVKDDLTGRQFGRLTVIKQTDDYIRSDGRRDAQWLCKCNCKDHKYVTARGSALKSGDKKSCGCLYYETFNKGNRYDLSGGFGILWSSNTNEEVYFDLDVANKILEHTWHIDISGYAATSIDGEIVRMHALLGYYYPDHHNRNKLDNRSNNLIQCSARENAINKSIKSDNSSGIIGVYFNKLRSKWVAQINDSKNHIKNLGSFKNKDDAIYARLVAEAEYYGDFAPQRHLFEQYGIWNSCTGGDDV